MARERAVTEEEGKKKAEELGMSGFIETSAKVEREHGGDVKLGRVKRGNSVWVGIQGTDTDET